MSNKDTCDCCGISDSYIDAVNKRYKVSDINNVCDRCADKVNKKWNIKEYTRKEDWQYIGVQSEWLSIKAKAMKKAYKTQKRKESIINHTRGVANTILYMKKTWNVILRKLIIKGL